MIRIKAISHSSHPQHDLHLFQHPSLYVCNVCGHSGFGPRFSCSDSMGCNFNLHEECCTDYKSTPISIHPFLGGSGFVLANTGGSIIPRYCDACRRKITGLYYYSNNSYCGDRLLHLSCARLPETITADSGMQMTLANRSNEKCSYSSCPKVNSGWSYFALNGHNYHVACWKQKELLKSNRVSLTTALLGQ